MDRKKEKIKIDRKWSQQNKKNSSGLARGGGGEKERGWTEREN